MDPDDALMRGLAALVARSLREAGAIVTERSGQTWPEYVWPGDPPMGFAKVLKARQEELSVFLECERGGLLTCEDHHKPMVERSIRRWERLAAAPEVYVVYYDYLSTGSGHPWIQFYVDPAGGVVQVALVPRRG